MKKHSNSKAVQGPGSYTRRAMIVFGCQTLVSAGLAARMYQLQIVEGEDYQARAERSRIKPKLLAPVRGQILARDGTPLAINRPNYRVVLYRERTDDLEATLARIAPLINLPEGRYEKLLQEVRATKAFLPVVIAENLDWEDFARVNANAPALQGVEPDVGLTRHYPEAGISAHIVGYVQTASERDVQAAGDDSALLSLPEMRVGRSGIERVEEKYLRGRAGLTRLEKDVHGRPIRELERREGMAGQDLTLTLDAGLQDYTMKRLGDQSAAVAVMDIYDGDVLALVSSPSFDPNSFVLGLSEKEWTGLRDNERRPLNNKTVAGLYPPGSTFKMVVALAALEEGLIGSGHSVYCPGHTELGSRRFHCWKRGGHGTLDLKNAIKQSCDVYFYDIAKRLGIDRLAVTARKFGIGVLPEFDLPDVKSGLMPDTDWKRRELRESWHAGETLIAGIGQGYMLTSPLQLATMTARIANGGYIVHPRLVKARGGESVKARSLIGTGIDETHIEAVKRAMSAVVNERGGTAYRSRIVLPGFEMAGKTGTAQVRRITKAERVTGVLSNDELPWKLRDHALFVAYVPAHAPRYAISVVVEHGGGGSKVAAPIARDVLLKLQFPKKIPLTAVPESSDPPFQLPDEDAEKEGTEEREA